MVSVWIVWELVERGDRNPYNETVFVGAFATRELACRCILERECLQNWWIYMEKDVRQQWYDQIEPLKGWWHTMLFMHKKWHDYIPDAPFLPIDEYACFSHCDFKKWMIDTMPEIKIPRLTDEDVTHFCHIMPTCDSYHIQQQRPETQDLHKPNRDDEFKREWYNTLDDTTNKQIAVVILHIIKEFLYHDDKDLISDLILQRQLINHPYRHPYHSIS